MRSELEFPVFVKTEKGKGAARRTRQAGLVPGVLYGYQTEPVMVAFEERNLVKVLGREFQVMHIHDLRTDVAIVSGQPVSRPGEHFRADINGFDVDDPKRHSFL